MVYHKKDMDRDGFSSNFFGSKVIRLKSLRLVVNMIFIILITIIAFPFSLIA
jgi:hypothetical protein